MAALIVRARDRACALRLTDIVEVMRPLPIEPISHAPPGVLGVAQIRGEPVPVVDLGALVDGQAGASPAAPGRFVTVRAGDRRAALAVDAVEGFRPLADEALHALPPLLSGARESPIGRLAALDRDLLLVLDAARLVPEDTP
jgi:purine-binding chemotaxis protein CheW